MFTYSERLCVINPGAPTALAKVTGMIVTARVRRRAAGGSEAPPFRPAQRKLRGCLGVSTGRFHEDKSHFIPRSPNRIIQRILSEHVTIECEFAAKETAAAQQGF